MASPHYTVVERAEGRIALCPGGHYCLPSAIAALLACKEFAPDILALELPHAAVSGLRRVLREDSPFISAVCLATRNGGYALGVSPADSLCQAARWGFKKGTKVVGIDLLIPTVSIRKTCLPSDFDPWAWIGNLPEPLRPWAGCWGADADEWDVLREAYMANAIVKLLLRDHTSILWVGGAQHGARLRALLSQETLPPMPHTVYAPKSCRSTLAYVSPETAIKHYLDDPPRACLDFYRAADDPARVAAFDKWETINTAIAEAAERYARAFKGLSPRALTLFQAYARKLVAEAGRLSPSLRQLALAADACVDSHFAMLLLERLLEYPFPNLTAASRDTRGGRPLLQEGKVPGIMEFTDNASPPYRMLYGRDGDMLATALDGEVDEHGERIERIVYRETSQVDESHYINCIPEAVAANTLNTKACLLAADIARELEIATQPFAQCLSLGNGVDVRATVCARARGERNLYVRVLRPKDDLEIDTHEPVVWDMCESRDRMPGMPTPLYGGLDPNLAWYAGEKFYYGWFYATNQRVNPTLIRWDWNAGLAVFFLVESFSQKKDRDYVLKNSDRVPRTCIFDNLEDNTASAVRAAAGVAAVTHARVAAIWVSPSRETIPSEALAQAAACGKHIIHLPSARFDPAELIAHTYFHLWNYANGPADALEEACPVPPDDILADIEVFRQQRIANLR